MNRALLWNRRRRETDQAAADRELATDSNGDPGSRQTHERSRTERAEGTRQRQAGTLVRGQASGACDAQAERRDEIAGDVTASPMNATEWRSSKMSSTSGWPRSWAALSPERTRHSRRSPRCAPKRPPNALRRPAPASGLKDVNNRNGHGAGDALLRDLVTVLRSKLRPYEPVVRWGGDEFVCAISGVGLDTVRARFEEIGAALHVPRTAITVGLAMLEPDDTLDALVERADANLLQIRQAR